MPDVAPVEAFLDHVTAFAHAPAVDTAMDWAETHGAEAAVTQLLAPAQLEVGRRWEFGEWTVAQEHAATAIVDDVLGGLHVELEVGSRVESPHVALVCAEGEWHVTPLRMAAVQLLARGWRVSVLGASVPADHLRATLEALSPDVLGVTTTLTLHLAGARRTTAAAHDVGIPVVVAGAAMDGNGHRAEAVGADAGARGVDGADRTMRRWLDEVVHLRAGVPAHAWEVERLRGTRTTVARGALARLEGSQPVVAAYDERRRTRTEEDLVWILRYVEASLDVDDPSVLHDFLGWLLGLLVVRGVPRELLVRGLDALHEQVANDLVDARQLLLVGRRWVENGGAPTRDSEDIPRNGDGTH